MFVRWLVCVTMGVAGVGHAGGDGVPLDGVAAPVAPSAAERPVRRIAVYRLESGGIDERVVDVITNSVVQELRKLDRITVVGMDEIRAMLDMEAQKQLVGCDDASCLADIAAALGVDAVIIGNVSIVGDSISFGLKNIDQREAKTVGQFANRVEGIDPAEVLALIGPAVAELFPNQPLRAGATRGVPDEIAGRIHPPPLDPWVFWTTAGVAGVAAATGVVFAAWNGVAYSAAIEKTESSVEGLPTNGADLNRDIDGVATSFVGVVAAGSVVSAAVISAGVVALFTDWDNVRGNE